MATPYDANMQISNLWDLNSFMAAGALRSNMEDMLKYAHAQMEFPQNNLGKAIELSHQPQWTDNKLTLGLNWLLFNNGINEPIRVWHNGGTGGFVSDMSVIPFTKTAFIRLVNSQKDFKCISEVFLNKPCSIE